MPTPDDDNLDWSQLVGPKKPTGPPPDGSRPPAVRPPRPGEVTTATVVLVVLGLFRFGVVVFALMQASAEGDLPGIVKVLSGLDLVLAFLLIACAAGIFRGSENARFGALVISVVHIVFGLIGLLVGNGVLAVVGILINVAVIALLNRYYVKDWCGWYG